MKIKNHFLCMMAIASPLVSCNSHPKFQTSVDVVEGCKQELVALKGKWKCRWTNLEDHLEGMCWFIWFCPEERNIFIDGSRFRCSHLGRWKASGWSRMHIYSYGCRSHFPKVHWKWVGWFESISQARTEEIARVERDFPKGCLAFVTALW